ncbi:MAG: phosphoribosyl-AMP cyclohydrolase [Desulfobacterium sp.]|nr:phosphoribosyl-AMP cyclohydrolase [Desulfobacterium sp.]MBU3950436.1 phosphoribosyl-AMP cyclohydrolase [Pseudomonadota bacterium]MBU4011230.1 phosphoribosyl-AMP cyclohydrolase [Pseudomonadota bacterium]MBU4037739.1 phosphoribosyl-AMP cyclohydrolase [Pseudomonadota bacterium]
MITLDFNKTNGLIPAIAQDHETGEVLMLAYMNRDAWEKTLATGKATYFSRSRQKLWIKGETSGNVQMVKEILIDCDDDTVLLKVEQIGKAACHTGHISCFYRKVENGSLKKISEPVFNPDEVYKK